MRDRSTRERKRLTRAKQLNVRETRSTAQLDYRVDEVLTKESAARQIIDDAKEVKSSLEREIASTASETARVSEEQNALQIEIREQRKTCKTAIAKSDLVAHTVSVSLRGEIVDLEEEVKCLRREESVRDRVHAHVADRVFRDATTSQDKNTASALRSTLRIREAEIADYEANIQRAREQQKHFKQLQEFTKTQSDAFAAVEEVVRRREDDERTSHALRFQSLRPREAHSRKGCVGLRGSRRDGCEEAREGQTPRSKRWRRARHHERESGRRGGRYRAWKT